MKSKCCGGLIQYLLRQKSDHVQRINAYRHAQIRSGKMLKWGPNRSRKAESTVCKKREREREREKGRKGRREKWAADIPCQCLCKRNIKGFLSGSQCWPRQAKLDVAFYPDPALPWKQARAPGPMAYQWGQRAPPHNNLVINIDHEQDSVYRLQNPYAPCMVYLPT